MCWVVKEKSNGYLVSGRNKGGFLLNNRYDAERLCSYLNERVNPNLDDLADECINMGDALKSFGEKLKKGF